MSRHPRHSYATILAGAPYAAAGECGAAVTTLRAADAYARTTLHPGQTLDVLCSGAIVARWTCSPTGSISRVCIA